MKTFKSLLILGVGALMCACTNEATEVAAPEVPGAEVTFDPNEITLGSSTVSVTSGTRAAITGDGSGTLNGIGVWCLAKDAMAVNQDPQGIRWFSDAPEHETCCIMENVKANIISNEVKWADASAIYYYPVTQFYRYEFYANYPYAPASALVYTDNSVVAKYTIDGTQDLLWGRATSDAEYAWSARYFRSNGGQTLENRPKLKMEHLLTRLVFKIQPGPQVEIPDADESLMDYTAAHNMTIDSLQILDAIVNVKMNIADYNNRDMSIGDRLLRQNNETDTLYLKDAAGEIVDPLQVPALPSLAEQWGESIMLYPADRYTVRIVLHDNTGRRFVSEIPLRLSGQPSFERGKSYNIIITVHGPTAVTLGAEVSSWIPTEGPGLDL